MSRAMSYVVPRRYCAEFSNLLFLSTTINIIINIIVKFTSIINIIIKFTGIINPIAKMSDSSLSPPL